MDSLHLNKYNISRIIYEQNAKDLLPICHIKMHLYEAFGN